MDSIKTEKQMLDNNLSAPAKHHRKNCSTSPTPASKGSTESLDVCLCQSVRRQLSFPPSTPCSGIKKAKWETGLRSTPGGDETMSLTPFGVSGDPMKFLNFHARLTRVVSEELPPPLTGNEATTPSCQWKGDHVGSSSEAPLSP